MAVALTLLVLGQSPALAQLVATPVAAFTGLDKITGRITRFEVYIGETVQFGSLLLTPRVCYARSAEDSGRATSFIEVDEVSLQADVTRVFTGWMFADSPALNAIDNAVYDIWLTGCLTSSSVPPPGQR